MSSRKAILERRAQITLEDSEKSVAGETLLKGAGQSDWPQAMHWAALQTVSTQRADSVALQPRAKNGTRS